ncbi:MAG: tail fiber domain-containing protein [Patescibacteria group bacterium]
MNGTTDFVNTRYGADGTDAGWILYGANANDIAFSGALVQPAGPIGGNGISSDARLKQDIEYLGGNSLDILGQISPASFAYITEPTQKRFGFIAQDLQRVIPEAVFQLSNDPFLRIDPTAILSHSVRAIQQLASTTAAIQNDYATSTDPVIRVDFSGNLAFGTTSPLTIWNSGVVTIGTSTVATSTHKLIVGGDIAATGFINISTEASKKDIEHLTEDEEAGILEKVKNTSVATYRYKSESATSTLRLGLIAEEAPEEVLSSDGKGVDIYKLSSFALAGIKAQQSQIEKMQLGIAGLSAVAGTLGSSTGTMLSDLGILFSNGITYIKNLAVETFKIGSPEKPSGVTLFDVDTGAPYCVVLKGGVLTPTAGECTTVPSSVSVPSEPPAQSVVGEEPIDTEAPVITLIGAAHITLEKGVSFIDPGATVADNVNSNLGVQAVGAEVDTNTVGDHIITYDATDSAGNKATQVTRTVTITGPVAVEEAASEAPPETPEAPEATEVPVAE